MTEDRRATVDPAKAEASRAGGSAPADAGRREGGPPYQTLYCDFCGHSQFEVEWLVMGPTVGICAECSDLVTSIIAEHRAAAPERAEPEAAGTTDPMVGNGSSAQEPEAASVLTPSKTGQTL